MSNTYAVIMAGGVGSRFWPKSRKSLPKQYLNLIGDETMIQMAARRLKRLVAEENVLIVTTEDQADLVKDQLPWIPEDNLIFEPFGKNTAPCIGLSAIHIKHLDPNAAMIVCPADHLISNSEKYLSILADGVKLVKSDPNSLVTIGIEPTYASTGYGYIQSGEPVAGEIKGAYKVQAFAEKPTTEVARQFFSSGEFLWNSGIFIWNVETILNYIEELMPDLYDGLLKIQKVIGKPNYNKVKETVYKQIYSESIDYGVLEQARNVLVLEGDFGWSDLGSWEEVYKILPKDEDGNVVKGQPLLRNVKNSYIECDGRLVTLVGVEDLIVVDTPDALLICNPKHSQDVKWIVEKLKHNKQNNLL